MSRPKNLKKAPSHVTPIVVQAPASSNFPAQDQTMETKPSIPGLVEKEFEALRQEIMDAVTETRKLEIQCLGASAVFWSWVLAQPMEAFWIPRVVWIPVILCFIAALRSGALYLEIREHAKYLKTVEIKWGLVISWENSKKRRYMAIMTAIIWAALIVGSFWAADFVRDEHQKAKRTPSGLNVSLRTSTRNV